MYSVDVKDFVVAVPDLPKPSAGAGEPTMFARDFALQLAYYVYGREDDVVLVTFNSPEAHYFGPPHDDAIAGHPLHSRGVDFYGAFEVSDSSWIRSLARMIDVQCSPDPNRFAGYRHFIITFHDSLFECIAGGFTTSMHKEHPAEVIRLASASSV